MSHSPSRSAPKRAYKARDPAITSRMMAAVRNKNSRAELLLRHALWRRGYRYRLHYKKLVGRPDLVFVARRVMVFVDSDFWHARILVEGDDTALRATIRGVRQDWWVEKLRRNVERDREVTTRLTADGWGVIRVWESDVLTDAERVTNKVERALKSAIANR